MKNREIQGLRAIAAVAVVLFHADFAWIPGGFLGVDVFFVISGYLVTQMIVRELSATGRIDLANFYSRRFRRLLPVAILVIITTIAVGRHLVSPIRHKTIAIDAISSIFYAANYRFYFSQIDYLNSGEKPTLFLHFWSLAVEEQFYLFWPILLLLGWQFYKRFGVLVILIISASFSFYYSLKFTDSNPTFAFYSLPTRAWEFALGALTFLLFSKLNKVPKFFRFLLGWSGLGVLIYSMIKITENQDFPGTITLIPTIATASIIAASSKGKFFGSFLITNPLFYGIGAVSYSLYLWHWPVYLLMQEVVGIRLDAIDLIIYSMILISLTLATYFVVEKPIRNYKRLGRKPSYGFIWSGAASLVAFFVAISIMGFNLPIISNQSDQVRSNSGLAKPSPSSIPISNLNIQNDSGLNLPIRTTSPIALSVLKDVSLEENCQSNYQATEIETGCIYGSPSGSKNIVIFGDSHAQQWVPALNIIGLSRNIKITVVTKSGCPSANLDVLYEINQKLIKYPQCAIWRKNAFNKINSMQAPDLIILGSSSVYNAGKDDNKTATYWTDGYKSTILSLGKYADRVIIMNDTPRPGIPSPIDCLGKNLSTPSKCDMKYVNVVAPFNRKPLIDQVALVNSISVIDPLPWVCFNTVCPAVLNGLSVYADSSHISKKMSIDLAALLEVPILKKLNS